MTPLQCARPTTHTVRTGPPAAPFAGAPAQTDALSSGPPSSSVTAQRYPAGCAAIDDTLGTYPPGVESSIPSIQTSSFRSPVTDRRPSSQRSTRARRIHGSMTTSAALNPDRWFNSGNVNSPVRLAPSSDPPHVPLRHRASHSSATYRLLTPSMHPNVAPDERPAVGFREPVHETQPPRFE